MSDKVITVIPRGVKSGEIKVYRCGNVASNTYSLALREDETYGAELKKQEKTDD